MRGIMTSAALTIAALLVAASAVAAAPVTTQACLQNRAIRSNALSADGGYFARTPQGWWRNTGPACSAYREGRALLTQSYNDRQCSGDVVRVFDQFSRIDYGNCVLGDWQKVAGPPVADAKRGR